MIKLFTGCELAATTGTKIFSPTANGVKTQKSPLREHMTPTGQTSPVFPAKATKQNRLQRDAESLRYPDERQALTSKDYEAELEGEIRQTEGR
jgi:hypothetical protein